MTELSARAQALLVALESDAPARPSFPEVYQRERDYVWKAVRRMGVPDRFVEDLVHDVFVVVHRLLDAYDPTRPIRPWLFAVVFRVTSDFRRKAQNVRERLDVAAEDATDGYGIEEELVLRQRRRMLTMALARVAPDRRAVLILHEIDGETMPTIAQALEIPVNTAYSRLRLGREDLARALRRMRSQEGSP